MDFSLAYSKLYRIALASCGQRLDKLVYYGAGRGSEPVGRTLHKNNIRWGGREVDPNPHLSKNT